MSAVMNTLSNLSNRLREMAERQLPTDASRAEVPTVEDWLRYWDDADSEPGNLRNYAYWLDRRREHC